MKITALPFIHCDICDTQITTFYLDKNSSLCCHCLTANKSGFPKGRGCYKFCKLCTAPKINWYYKATYGKIATDCGNHEPDDQDINIFE